jgi:hypothetical protein
MVEESINSLVSLDAFCFAHVSFQLMKLDMNISFFLVSTWATLETAEIAIDKLVSNFIFARPMGFLPLTTTADLGQEYVNECKKVNDFKPWSRFWLGQKAIVDRKKLYNYLADKDDENFAMKNLVALAVLGGLTKKDDCKLFLMRMISGSIKTDQAEGSIKKILQTAAENISELEKTRKLEEMKEKPKSEPKPEKKLDIQEMLESIKSWSYKLIPWTRFSMAKVPAVSSIRSHQPAVPRNSRKR